MKPDECHCSNCSQFKEIERLERVNTGLHKAIDVLALRLPPAARTTDMKESITSLCDRLDRIHNICHNRTMQPEEKVRQIEEWSGGFMPIGGPENCEHEWKLESGFLDSTGEHYMEGCLKCAARRERNSPVP